MSAKKIIFDHEALETIKFGVKQLADAVKVTLGHGSQCYYSKKFRFTYDYERWRLCSKGN